MEYLSVIVWHLSFCMLAAASCQRNGPVLPPVSPISFVKEGNLKKIKKYIAEKGDPHFLDDEGNSMLHWVAILPQLKQQKEITETLLQAGTNPNSKNKAGITPLAAAIISENHQMFQCLLAAQADTTQGSQEGDLPLHLACRLKPSKENKIIQILIQGSTNINVQNGRGRTPLHYAVDVLNDSTAKLLLEAKADANKRDQEGKTPLCHAFDSFEKMQSKEAYEMIKVLLPYTDVNTLDQRKRTPLHKVIGIRDPSLVKQLLSLKADPNSKDLDGYTPMDYAYYIQYMIHQQVTSSRAQDRACYDQVYKQLQTIIALLSAAGGHPVIMRPMVQAEAAIL